MSNRRTPGQRAGLTRAQIVEAAHILLDDGLEALTMRALARQLDVAPNALYSHVPSKDALIDEILDDVLAGVEAPDLESEDPVAGLYAVMASTYDVLLEHRDLVPLYLARHGASGPNAQRLGDIMLELLARAGTRQDRRQEAVSVLVVYTIGFAAFATHQPTADGRDPEQMGETFDGGLRWLLTGIASASR